MHEALQLRTVAKLNIHEFENFKRDVKSNKREVKYLWYVRGKLKAWFWFV